MPTPVRLDFVPPTQPDLASLHVEEAATVAGVYTEVFTTNAIGASPNYISYVTFNATSPNYWFRIFWRNAGGADTPYSIPVQGGTSTIVQAVVDRVLLRDPAANEVIVTQTAEWVVTQVMHVTDPYDVSLTATYAQLEGMTLLTLARSALATFISSSQSESYSAGLVSQKSSSGTAVDPKLIQYLLDQANKILGIGFTYVMLLEDIDPIGIGALSGIDFDESRTMVTFFE